MQLQFFSSLVLIALTAKCQAALTIQPPVVGSALKFEDPEYYYEEDGYFNYLYNYEGKPEYYYEEDGYLNYLYNYEGKPEYYYEEDGYFKYLYNYEGGPDNYFVPYPEPDNYFVPYPEPDNYFDPAEYTLDRPVVGNAIQSQQDLLNTDAFRPGVAPYCNEECPAGYEYISELGHCYRLLLDLGPTSQDRGVQACGFALGFLPMLDKKHDEDIIRSYFWDKYEDQMRAHTSWLKNAGFWTAYMRMAEDGHNAEDLKKMFVNMYTGDSMPVEFWRPGGNPRNERYDQACVARKWFNAEFIPLNGTKSEDLNGLDDYVCGYPHWVVCQVRKEFALNKRAYNVKLMQQAKDDVNANPSAECSEPWEQQMTKQFDILIGSAEDNGNTKALNAYSVAQDHIKVPTFKMVTQ